MAMKAEHLEIVTQLSEALRKLTVSTSAHLGADCMLHANLAQRFLSDHGIATRVVVGEAAWRVGPGDGDVIVHCPAIHGYAVANVAALAYHAWLDDGDNVIDFTTHTLVHKAQQLDAFDGGKTCVAWCPPFLVVPRAQLQTLNEVTMAANQGVCCYRELDGLAAAISSHLPRQSQVDEEALTILRLLFANPTIVLRGPNDHAAVGQPDSDRS